MGKFLTEAGGAFLTEAGGNLLTEAPSGPITSTGSVGMGSFGVSGVATFPAPVSATGSVRLGTFGITGAAKVPVVTSGSVGIGSFGITGTGKVSVGSTGSAHMGSFGITGSSSSTVLFDVAPTTPPLPLTDLNPMLELYLRNSNAWLDVSPRVFYDTVTIQRGGPDESTTTSAAIFTGSLDNHDGVLSNLNPMSPYYGELGLNTPLRVSVPNGSTYMRLEEQQSNFAGTPSSSAINALSSFEVWVDADADNWYSPQILASKYAASSNERSWALCLPGDGTVQLIVSGTGSNTFFLGSGVKLPIVHGRMSIRASYNQATSTITFYTGQFCTGWTVLGGFTFSGAPAPFASTSMVEVGACSDFEFPETEFIGKFYAFALISGVGNPIGSAVAVADFTQVSVGATSFTDVKGNAWSLFNDATISNRDYRFFGESAAWPQSWSVGSPNARIQLEAGGLLRRLGAVGTTAGSAMFRAYTRITVAGSNIIDYWPMEDLSQATQLASATGGFPCVLVNGVQPGASSDFACSAGIPSLSGGAITAAVQPYTPGTVAGFSGSIIRFLMTMPDSDTAGAVICRVRCKPNAAGLNYIDVIYGAGGTSFTCNGVATSGSNLWSQTFGSADLADRRASIELINNGSTWSAAFVWLSVGETSGFDETLASGLTGTPPIVADVIFNAGGAGLLTSMAVGHLSVQDFWSSLFDMSSALNAYESEPAGVRFQRVCAEEGVAFRSMGALTDTVLMGQQTVETVAQLLQECVDADQGIWYEPKQVLGWGYRTRASLSNQLPAITFDYNQDHLSDTLEPTIDDQVRKNDVTVTSQSGGSSARAVLNDGSPGSVGDIGRYDTEVTVNVDNSLLASEAGWLLWLLSCGDPRYKAINCDLANATLAGLYYLILQLDVGDRLNVASPPVWLPPGVVDQLYKGTTETISSKAFKMSWNGIPCLPWNVAIFNDTVYGRFDTDGSQLASAVTSTATTLSVATVTSGSPLWTVVPGDFPFNIGIEGELITVTNITGASSPQSFTVTRSINGVVKTHAANAVVDLLPLPIISL